VGEAFQPLGVYLNFWQPSLRAGAERDFAVMLVNDEEAATAGEVTLAFERGGQVLASRQAPFSLAPLGQQTLLL
jgi:hypothetical protein